MSKFPTLFSFLFGILFLLPIAFLMIGAFTPTVGSTSTLLGSLSRAFLDPETPGLVLNTLIYGGGGALIGVPLGVVYSWIIGRTDVPGKRLLWILAIMPLTIPFIVKAYGWILLASPRIGLLNLIFASIFHTAQGPLNIFTMLGITFAWGVGGLPLIVLTMSAALEGFDPAIEEASLASGAGVLRTFFRVSIPLMRPAITGVFMLIFVVGMSNLEYPLVIGTPSGINTLATVVLEAARETIPPDFGLGAADGLIFLVITMATIALYIRYTQKTFRFVTVLGITGTRSVVRLGKWRFGALAICLAILTVSLFLPLFIIGFVSLVPFYNSGPNWAQMFYSFTLHNYVTALQEPLFQIAVINSYLTSISTAAACCVIAPIIGYAIFRVRHRGSRILDYLVNLPLSFPGVVVDLGLFWAFLLVPILSFAYGTIFPLAVALVIVWMPLAVRIVSGSLIQIAPEIEEAATMCGARWGRTFITVTLPLIRRAIANTFIYVFVDAFRDLGAVILLVTPSSYVMITLLTDLMTHTSSDLSVIAAVSSYMIMMLGGTVLLMYAVSRFRLPNR